MFPFATASVHTFSVLYDNQMKNTKFSLMLDLKKQVIVMQVIVIVMQKLKLCKNHIHLLWPVVENHASGLHA